MVQLSECGWNHGFCSQYVCCQLGPPPRLSSTRAGGGKAPSYALDAFGLLGMLVRFLRRTGLIVNRSKVLKTVVVFGAQLRSPEKGGGPFTLTAVVLRRWGDTNSLKWYGSVLIRQVDASNAGCQCGRSKFELSSHALRYRCA